MLSPSYGKEVFIDFGLSRLIEENAGLKSLTTFSGSAHFCSPEMAKSLFQIKNEE